MFTRFFLSCFVLLSVHAFAWAAETQFEVIDSEENSIFGTVVALDRTQVVVDVQGTFCTIPLEKLVNIRNIAPSPYGQISFPTASDSDLLRQMPTAPLSTTRGANRRRLAETLAKKLESDAQAARKTFPYHVVALELKDGSRLTASSLTVTNNQCDVRLLDQQNDLSLSLNTISAIRFAVRSLSEVVNPPADWQRLAVPNAKGDRLVIGNPGSFDVYTGILNDISAETVSFAVDGEVLPVPRRKAFGLVLHHESPSTGASLLGTLTLWTGTRGMFTDIRLHDDELTWTTSSGLTATVPLAMVDEIDFGEKRTYYLADCELVQSQFSLPFASDIKPAQLKFLQTFYESRTKNASCEAVLDGIVYGRSITLRGKTSLEYLLPKPFASLKAIIGIEDQFRPYATATLQILADSQILGTWELRGDSASQRIYLNLPQNCRVITLIAEPPPQSNVPAVLTIANPQLFE